MKVFIRARPVGISLAFIFLFACQSVPDQKQVVSLLLENGNPAGFIIPSAMVNPDDEQTIKNLRVHVKGRPEPVLGSFTTMGSRLVFHSLVKPSAGFTYEIKNGEEVLGEIAIPVPDSSFPPSVTEIYPANDTVPENLLKFYLKFNMPMQEGFSLEHICLLNMRGDTLKNVFLDLQPELWNNDRTVLTLWLDPGRIKRNLQPNLTLGPPLNSNERYQLVAGKGLRGNNGMELSEGYIKSFISAARDSTSPDPASWIIDIPKAGTANALIIDFQESLDHMLALNSIRILNEDQNSISGHFELRDEDKLLFFFPDRSWDAGNYHLHVDEQLEDLAGNNLLRLFDNDMEQPKNRLKTTGMRNFSIR